jgi:hypothetical protein
MSKTSEETGLLKPLKKIEMKNKTPMSNNLSKSAPEPGDLRVIILTCGFSLGTAINLDLIARELAIDDQIIGVKLPGIVEKGSFAPSEEPHPVVKRKKKFIDKSESITPKRIDFGNQCSLRIIPRGSNQELNFKLFGNGNGVIAGATNKEYAEQTLNVLKSLIRPLEHDYQINCDLKLTQLFPSTSDYLKCIKRNYMVFLKVFSLLGINIDLKLDLVLNNSLLHHYPLEPIIKDNEKKRPHLIDLYVDLPFEEAISKGILMSGSSTDLINYSRIIQAFNICSHYCPNDPKHPILMMKLSDPNDPLQNLICRLYRGEVCRLPMTYEIDQFNTPHQVVIDNYNTMYNCNFHIDREVFTPILNSKYKGSTIVNALYKTNYPGINVKYVSRVDCQPDCQSTGQKTKKDGYKCPCKEITFLIFQEGKIMITGARSWNQILDGYRVNTEIMKIEYPHILIEPAKVCEPRNQKWPAQIVQQIAGQKYVYINKKQQLIENPPNYFILKTHNLLDHYLL